MKITQTQLEQVNDRMQALIRSNSFYGKKAGSCRHDRSAHAGGIREAAVFGKERFADAYPLGPMAVPEEEVVRSTRPPVLRAHQSLSRIPPRT